MSGAGTFLIETPGQLRAIADPLRQRLLQAFAEPKPIRRAAAELGESPTKLYRHVDQLLAAGLIRVARHFQTVAARFEVMPGAIGDSARVADRRAAIARANLAELLDGAAPAAGTLRIARTSARLTTAAMEQLEAAFARLLEDLSDPSAPEVDLLLFSARRSEPEVSGSGS
jgi:DNA-binding MarR family transcriptional regulator